MYKFERIELELNDELEKENALFIPIGNMCTSSIFLRNCGIKNSTYPYDWAREVSVEEIIECIKNKDSFNIDNWYRLKNKPYYLPHDKEDDTHGDEENHFLNEDCKGKYKRRFERLFNDITKKNVILVQNYTYKKITENQKDFFRSINKSISFITLYNFDKLSETGEEYNKYMIFMLSHFKKNIISCFIRDALENTVYKLEYPCNYDIFYENIKILIEKYDIDKTLFQEINLKFNNQKDVISFLGNSLSKKYNNIELL